MVEHDDRLDPTLERDLGAVLNRYSAENGSNTPDFILAHYLLGCLAAWNAACKRRDAWYLPHDDRPPARCETTDD